VAITPKMRFWFRRKEPYLVVLISFVFLLPILIWNWEYFWISFQFQMSHGLGKSQLFSARIFFRNLAAQAGSYSPFLFVLFVFTFLQTGVSSFLGDDRFKLAFSFALPIFFLFGLSSLANEVLPHWPAVGYLVLMPTLGDTIAQWITTGCHRNKILRIFLTASLVIGGIMTLIIPVQAVFKPLPIPSEVDPTNDLVGWPQIAERIATIKQQEPERNFFIFTHKFYLASQIAFHLPSDYELYCLSPSLDQYDLWQRRENLRKNLENRNGLYFADQHFFINPSSLYRFRNFSEKETVTIFLKGKIAKKFFIVRCYGFDPRATQENIFSAPVKYRSLWEKIQKWNVTCFLKVNSWSGKNQVVDRFFSLVGWFGSGYITVPIVSFIIWRKKRKRWLPYFLVFATALISGGLAVHFLKEWLQVPRPAIYFAERQSVNILGSVLKSGSWPSGHAQTAFSAVFFLTWFQPQQWYLWWLVGGLAGLSRCYVGVHFPLDVFGGLIVAAISFYLMRWAVLKIYSGNLP
ncbi:MAG: phosphatase PAP2 family protein, partial [Candidatus Omnitrophica bacterium]|nr:phosphatase PAP2 family protein [Candidatus Omnitrophota bacterium]